MKLSLQKYFNEHKMERTVESALIRRFNIFVVNSIHLYCERDKFLHFYSPVRVCPEFTSHWRQVKD